MIMLEKEKTPDLPGSFLFAVADFYLLAVLSRNGRLVAVVDVTVMSPRAVMV